MNKLITDRPSEWKDWIIEQIEGIENDMLKGDKILRSICVVAVPETVTGDNVFMMFYNAGRIEKVVIRDAIDVDMLDSYILENMNRLYEDGVTFHADTSNDENGEDDYSENEC